MVMSDVCISVCDGKKGSNTKKDDFHQQLACKAPIRWLKYTTATLSKSLLLKTEAIITKPWIHTYIHNLSTALHRSLLVDCL